MLRRHSQLPTNVLTRHSMNKLGMTVLRHSSLRRIASVLSTPSATVMYSAITVTSMAISRCVLRVQLYYAWGPSQCVQCSQGNFTQCRCWVTFVRLAPHPSYAMMLPEVCTFKHPASTHESHVPQLQNSILISLHPPPLPITPLSSSKSYPKDFSNPPRFSAPSSPTSVPSFTSKYSVMGVQVLPAALPSSPSRTIPP